VPYLFEGHRIRVSTDQQGEAWIVVADACAALAESPMVWAMANRRDEEEHCLHSQEGPGAGGFTLALINEATLLRRLLNSDNPSAPRMRRWLTHELLPALQRRHQRATGDLPRPSIEAIRRQIGSRGSCAEPTRSSTSPAYPHAEALLSVLEEIQANSSPAAADEKQRVLAARRGGLAGGRSAGRPAGSARSASTNQRLAAAGLQQRNEDDDWQLTEAGRDWGRRPPALQSVESAASRSSGIRPWWRCWRGTDEQPPRRQPPAGLDHHRRGV
jgi:hypothetical protein